MTAVHASTFDGLSLARLSDGTTVIHGPVVDQAALHGVLRKVRDVGLPLVSVIRVEPDDSDAPTIGPDRHPPQHERRLT